MCVCVHVQMCVHCWWIKTTVADGVSEWEAGREETGSSHSFVCFSPVSSLKMLQYRFCFHTHIIAVAVVYQ